MINLNVIGVMSGTSLDGIDMVYVNFTKDKIWKFKILNSITYKYSDFWKKKLNDLTNLKSSELKKIDIQYSSFLAEQIKVFIKDFSVIDIDFISSHGHTATHDPKKSNTYQIGNLGILSDLLNYKVICDFRVQDVQLGGQGAPLVPVGEKLLFSDYDTFINLGGFANITKVSKESLLAYDICPVNIVLNKLVEKKGLDFDDKGEIASSGNLIKEMSEELNRLTYYNSNPPKSLGKEWVLKNIYPIIEKYKNLRLQDILNTYCNHICYQISKNLNHSHKVFISGGGAYNEYLIETLKSKVDCKLSIPHKEIIEFKEALIFAFLGVLRVLEINNCYSSVTGAIKDHCSGKILTPKF